MLEEEITSNAGGSNVDRTIFQISYSVHSYLRLCWEQLTQSEDDEDTKYMYMSISSDHSRLNLVIPFSCRAGHCVEPLYPHNVQPLLKVREKTHTNY